MLQHTFQQPAVLLLCDAVQNLGQVGKVGIVEPAGASMRCGQTRFAPEQQGGIWMIKGCRGEGGRASTRGCASEQAAVCGAAVELGLTGWRRSRKAAHPRSTE